MNKSLKRIQEEHLVVFTDVPDFEVLDSWLRRAKNSLKKVAPGKDSAEKCKASVDPLLEQIK